MQRTRPSSWFAGTMKSKFKNDAKNVVDVDGDDDFVTPAPVQEDQFRRSVQTNMEVPEKKEKTKSKNKKKERMLPPITYPRQDLKEKRSWN
ncbi:hypothetical protein LXL04_021446 [Taraxacum kok-saghyz]